MADLGTAFLSQACGAIQCTGVPALCTHVCTNYIIVVIYSGLAQNACIQLVLLHQPRYGVHVSWMGYVVWCGMACVVCDLPGTFPIPRAGLQRWVVHALYASTAPRISFLLSFSGRQHSNDAFREVSLPPLPACCLLAYGLMGSGRLPEGPALVHAIGLKTHCWPASFVCKIVHF